MIIISSQTNIYFYRRYTASMGVIKNQTIKGTIYSYIGVVLGFVNIVLLFPRILDTEQVGLLNILVAISTIFAQFGSLGFPNVTTRLFSYFRSKERAHNGFVSLALLVTAVGSAFILIVFKLFEKIIIQQNSSESGLLTTYFSYNYLLILFTILFNVLDNYSKVLYRSTSGTLHKEVIVRVINFCNLIILHLGYIDFDYFVLIYVLTLCYPSIALLIYLYRAGEMKLNHPFKFIHLALRRQILRVAFFGFLSGMGGIAISNVDKYIVNSYLNLSLTGIYSVASFFGTLILMPSRSVSKISSAVLADAWKKKDRKLIESIHTKSCINQYTLGVLLCIGLLGNIDNIFRILPSEYAGGRYVLAIFALANLLEMLSGASGMIIQTSRYYSFLTYSRAGFIVVLIGANMLFIPIWGLTGAAVAVFATRLVSILCNLLYIYYKFGFQPFTNKTLHVTLLGIAAFLLGYYLPHVSNLIIDLALRSTVICGVFVGGLYYIKPSAEVQDALVGILKKVLNYLPTHKK